MLSPLLFLRFLPAPVRLPSLRMYLAFAPVHRSTVLVPCQLRRGLIHPSRGKGKEILSGTRSNVEYPPLSNTPANEWLSMMSTPSLVYLSLLPCIPRVYIADDSYRWSAGFSVSLHIQNPD